jgi:hypothetical protein
MSVAQETGKSESFQTKLAELRLRIDALPESQRNHLYELADAIAERHQHLQHRLSTRHDSV